MEMNNTRSELLPFDFFDINDPMIIKNLQEINETEEKRTNCLEMLRRHLKNLKDIEPCLDESFVLSFLRASKYDVSKALQRVINYYQHFDVALNTFKKMSFPLREAENIRHLKISPFRCRDNSFLIIGKAEIDYKKYNFGHRFYLEVVATHALLENPVNQICGGTYIFDYEGFGIRGYLAFTPFWVRFFVNALMFTFPCRLKAIHLVNTPSFYPLILKIVYPLLPKKMQERVFVYAKNSDWKDLHASIPPDILPEKFGGKLKEDQFIDALSNLKEKDQKFFNLFAFGNKKTKKARQSMKVLQ